jgi:microcystin-dependent protein
MFVEPYLANMAIFAGNFAPRGWMFCQGQLLAIAEYDALFALIGTTYGGDGQTTFGLPDLRSRTSLHMGQGPGLNNYTLGQMSGSESVTLTTLNLPSHIHTTPVITGNPQASTDTTSGVNTPGTNLVPASGATLYNTVTEGLTMGPYSGSTVTPVAGGSQPAAVITPYLAMNYVIAVEGIFPSRN